MSLSVRETLRTRDQNKEMDTKEVRLERFIGKIGRSINLDGINYDDLKDIMDVTCGELFEKTSHYVCTRHIANSSNWIMIPYDWTIEDLDNVMTSTAGNHPFIIVPPQYSRAIHDINSKHEHSIRISLSSPLRHCMLVNKYIGRHHKYLISVIQRYGIYHESFNHNIKEEISSRDSNRITNEPLVDDLVMESLNMGCILSGSTVLRYVSGMKYNCADIDIFSYSLDGLRYITSKLSVKVIVGTYSISSTVSYRLGKINYVHMSRCHSKEESERIAAIAKDVSFRARRDRSIDMLEECKDIMPKDEPHREEDQEKLREQIMNTFDISGCASTFDGKYVYYNSILKRKNKLYMVPQNMLYESGITTDMSTHIKSRIRKYRSREFEVEEVYVPLA